MRKRFTYWTEDGKRHWTPFMGVKWPDSFGPLKADSRYACRNRSQMKPATHKHRPTPLAKARVQERRA